MGLVSAACEQRAHLVLESGTGTGKTVCALCGALEFCKSRGKKLVYVTRTNSQQRQVMLELREIAERMKVFGVALQGRKHMCPLAGSDQELSKGNPEELSKVCSERKARVIRGDEEACKYYAATISEDLQIVTRYAREELPTAEEFVAHCVDLGFCPYEISKMHVPAADVVAAPYIMFFDGFIRHALLDWMACTLQDVVLIVDEAHNLPWYSRELESATLGENALRLAEGELEEFGDPEVAEGVSLRDFLVMTSEVLENAVEEYLIDEDGIIPQSLLEEELMFRTRQTSRGLTGILGQINQFGEMVRDNRRMAGRLPRSYVHGTAGFLNFWQKIEEEAYVKLITKYDSKAFEAYCLDASIACRPLAECHATIHMSGTLTPMDEYRDSIGLPKDSRLERVPSPFPTENRLVLYADDVTTKFEDIERDDRMIQRIAEHISSIVTGVPRSTIVFYPSYAVMERISSRTRLAVGGRKVMVERREMGQGDFMDLVGDFKAAPGKALMHAIAGGRISEGIDFPGEELEVAIIAGIPYPKPTAKQRAFQHFCELRFGDGWERAVKAPTTRKLLQAIGRLIRSEQDRGAAVILDKRAVQFSETIGAKRSSSPPEDIRRFFECEPRPASPLTVHARERKGLQL